MRSPTGGASAAGTVASVSGSSLTSYPAVDPGGAASRFVSARVAVANCRDRSTPLASEEEAPVAVVFDLIVTGARGLAGIGTLLLIGAVTVLVRGVRTSSLSLIALAALALAAIVGAWLSGARFVGTATDGALLAMAIATGVATLAYTLITLILFLVTNPATIREAHREGAA
jgi:hypothetical protein